MTADTLPRQGFISGIPDDLYHADRGSLSQSGAKLILRAPAKFRWQQDHPKTSTNRFDFGKAAHLLVLGTGAELEVFEYDTDKIKSPKATNAFKARQAELQAREGVLLLPDEYAVVQAMADKLSEHRIAMELLSEGEPEVSAYAEDPGTGVMMRGRFDWLGALDMSDYKTAASADPDEFCRSATKYGYDLQVAWYLDLGKLNGHPAKAFAHIVQEIEPPYIVTVVVLPPELVERGRILKRRALERYRDCLESGRWPGYLPDTEFATPAAPQWVLRELADEEISQW